MIAFAPPPQPGPWKPVGALVASLPSRPLHFFRITTSPKALAIVVRSSSAKPIRVQWFSYCEFESDDAMTNQNQATVSGVHAVTAYPPVLDGATMCTVSVVARVAGGRARAAIFSY